MDAIQVVKQDIFDKVATHLLKQNKRCEGDVQLVDGSNYHGCLYRGPNSLKCAAGCLIPDEDYKPELEGHSIDEDAPYSLISEYFMEKYEYNKEIIRFIKELQVIHDCSYVEDWKSELKNRAKREGLTFPTELE